MASLSLTSAVGALLVGASLSLAPFQCAHDPDPSQVREETPAEALYGLAEKFKADGDEAARVRTLEYLIARYPSSRFAVMAKDDLAQRQK